MHTLFLLKGMKGQYDLEDVSEDKKVILKWILNVRAGGFILDSSGSSYAPIAESCGNGNNPFDLIKEGE
jgi:hypothetical protein